MAPVREGLRPPEGRASSPARPSRSSSRPPISASARGPIRSSHPTQLAARIFAAGRDLLARETDGTQFRLIGIGVSALGVADGADRADLLDRRTAEAEEAIDRLREKFGDDAVIKGLALDRSDE